MLKLWFNFWLLGSFLILKVLCIEFDNNLEYGLCLLVVFNMMGMVFVLFKDEDVINFEDLNNEWLFVFRRGKVLKGIGNLYLFFNEFKGIYDKVSKVKYWIFCYRLIKVLVIFGLNLIFWYLGLKLDILFLW